MEFIRHFGNRRYLRYLIGVLIGVVILSSVCGRKQREPSSSKLRQEEKIPRFPKEMQIQVSGIPLKVEVCETPQARQRGLMFRTYLPADEGMLFIFDTEGHHPFWMKNTYIPLSIAFINREGKIVQIEDMKPQDLTLHIPAYPILYALEVNQGWFRKNRIKVGDKVTFPLETE